VPQVSFGGEGGGRGAFSLLIIVESLGREESLSQEKFQLHFLNERRSNGNTKKKKGGGAEQ